MPNLHTHTHNMHSLDVKICSLRGEGRRGLEGRLKNGVRIKSYDYIRLDLISFFVEIWYTCNLQLLWKRVSFLLGSTIQGQITYEIWKLNDSVEPKL